MSNKVKNIILTGASGFVGQHLVEHLSSLSDFHVIAVSRKSNSDIAAVENVTRRMIKSYSDMSQVTKEFPGAFALIHLAAMVHRVGEENSLDDFRDGNVQSTRSVVDAAIEGGIKKFIFMSSIKVLGESTPLDRPFKASDAAEPKDDYSKSKFEAEQLILKATKCLPLDVVIIRPPLIYGPGVGANFESLMRLIRSNIPLPFGGINNKRSFISIYNLVDLIEKCLNFNKPLKKVLVASDGTDLSTPELIKILKKYLGGTSCLLSINPTILSFIFKLLGRGDQFAKINESLVVDMEETKSLIGWMPLITTEQGLKSTAEHFNATH